MDIRESIFEKYYENLCGVKSHPRIHLEPDIPDSITCPQCFKVIERSEIFNNNLFSLEHVPPESLGGKIETFTCKKCNNWSGHYLESHLTHSLDMANFLSGVPGSATDGIVKFSDDLYVTAELKYLDKDYLYIRADQDRSIPGSVEKSFKALEKGKFNLNLRSRGKRGKVIRPRRAEAAILRIAYLKLFSKFGYGFLLYPGAQIIRSQFKKPDEKILPHWGIFSGKGINQFDEGVYIITSPQELRSYMVIIELTQGNKTIQYSVLIPGPTKPHVGIYDYINANKKHINFTTNKLE